MVWPAPSSKKFGHPCSGWFVLHFLIVTLALAKMLHISLMSFFSVARSAAPVSRSSHPSVMLQPCSLLLKVLRWSWRSAKKARAASHRGILSSWSGWFFALKTGLFLISMKRNVWVRYQDSVSGPQNGWQHPRTQHQARIKIIEIPCGIDLLP